MDSCAERGGSSARADTDFTCGWARIFHADKHGSSVRFWVENGRNQKAKFVRNNAEGSINTLQRSFELSL